MTGATIGILAGMGPSSTAPFLDLLIAECRRRYGARDDIDFPKMMICSQPAPFYEGRPIDHAAMEAAIKEGLASLERAGADFLAIACNTAHIYYPQLARSVRRPLLNIVKATLRRLPGGVSRVALAAARPTVEAGIYQRALEVAGIQVMTDELQPLVDALLKAVRETASPIVFEQHWSALYNSAHRASADVILVACLDLTGTLAHAPPEASIVDAGSCFAEEIVETWLRIRSDAQDAASNDKRAL